MVIAVDFDGTLAGDSEFPKIGEPIQPVIDWVIAQKKLGHKLILWTCREGEVLYEAVTWAFKQGIKFDAINENLPENKFLYLGKAKILADIYLDDKSKSIAEMITMPDAKEYKRY